MGQQNNNQLYFMFYTHILDNKVILCKCVNKITTNILCFIRIYKCILDNKEICMYASNIMKSVHKITTNILCIIRIYLITKQYECMQEIL